MAKQSKAQKETIGRVMHEFKHGELTIGGNGPPVTDPKQAIAVALREAGATNTATPAENRAALRRTKRAEKRDEVAKGRQADGESRAALYAEAKRRELPGRSTMSRDALKRALGR